MKGFQGQASPASQPVGRRRRRKGEEDDDYAGEGDKAI